MRLVHSISLYDEDEKRDIIFSKVWCVLSKEAPIENIINIIDEPNLDTDFMKNVVKVYLEQGKDAARAFARDVYGYKEG